MSTPEGEVRNAIMDWLRLFRIKCWIHDSVGIFDPTTGRFRRRHGKYRVVGLPDIHGVLPGGTFFAIEVKSPKGRVSPEQTAQIDELTSLGALSFIARSIKDVQDKLLPLMRGFPT